MYRQTKPLRTTIKRAQVYEGESIEKKINRIVNNKEPIKDGAPIIYTERKDGVQPQYDIRTDRFEIAVEAMDAVSKSHKAKREESIAARAKKGMEEEKKSEKETKKGDGGPESIGHPDKTDPK